MVPRGAPQYSENGKKFSSSDAMNLGSTKVEGAPVVWNLPPGPDKLSRNIRCLCVCVWGWGGMEAPEQLSGDWGSPENKVEGLCPSPDEFIRETMTWDSV